MDPQVIRLKDSILPMPGDTTIFEIEHELPYEGAKFSSRYEIYNSTNKPFTAAYRELTLTSSASSQNENTTYITCTAQLEPLQINGFHCVDEMTQHRSVCAINEDHDHINGAANYEMIRTKTLTACESDSDIEPPQMNNVSKFYINNELQTQFVTTENCSTPPKVDSLKSPPLLKQLILDTGHQGIHSSQTRVNNSRHREEHPPTPMPRCTSLLNLQIKPPESPPKPKARPSDVVALTPEDKENISKTISLMLAKRQKDFSSKNNVIPPRKFPPKREFNEGLINDNVELIERFTSNTLDRSCRVTGELLKQKIDSEYHRNACTLPRTPKSHRSQLQRHFYHPRSSNCIPDEELPDPDQVRNTRELFERVLKTGSMENVSLLPKHVKTWTRATPEIRQPRIQLQKSTGADDCQPYKWSDTGSISSGVGSDISFDTEPRGSDRGSKEDVALDSEGNLSSVREGKVISEDVLRSIRAYGTCVTYFGGKVISSTEGFSCSPMTMTIMNEIEQSSPEYRANRKFLFFDDRQPVKFRLLKNGRPPCQGSDEDKRKLNTLYEDCNNNEIRSETNTMIEDDEVGEGKLVIKLENSSVDSEEDEKVATNSNSSAQKWNYAHISVESKPRCDMEFEEFQVLDDKTTS